MTVHPRRDVQIPRQLLPRLVIEFSEGLPLLLEDHAAISARRRVRSHLSQAPCRYPDFPARANSTLYLTSWLAITLPFNITLGIPIYLTMARTLY